MYHPRAFQRNTIYELGQEKAFCGWVTCHDFGDRSRIGISFTETKQGDNPDMPLPRLEFGEAAGAPVSYCSVECGSRNTVSQRVYMRSEDGGRSFSETGRCPLQEGSFVNIGFPDGRIIGLNVDKRNREGTAWDDAISVRESMDGGTTWKLKGRLLEGCAVYLWRVRRLKDGSAIILASFYGTPWGPGLERPTRNTELPGETYIGKIQTFFLHTTDGESFSGPHYVLPGTGAHEFDAAELPDGRLLFVAGDVQATPVARQLVRRIGNAFVNGPILPISKGAPEDPERNPQGGYVPETFVCLDNGLLIGTRRNKPYSCSMDEGGNWYSIDGIPAGRYQPVMTTPDGKTVAAFGHLGGDNALGQVRMQIDADLLAGEGFPPMGSSLRIERMMSADGSKYENRFRACLTANGNPIAGETITFRFVEFWAEDGSVSTISQQESLLKIDAVTDEDGNACVAVPEYDRVRDIHFAYRVDAAFMPKEGGEAYAPCISARMTVLALTPKRCCPYPYDAYFAEGCLFVSPNLEKRFPDVVGTLKALAGTGRIPSDKALCKALEEAGVIRDGAFSDSIHGHGLMDAAPMGAGDLFQ